MDIKWILFEGSFNSSQYSEGYSEAEKKRAREVAACLGRRLIENGFGVMLTSCYDVTADAGKSAVEACGKLGINSAARIKTYLYGEDLKTKPGCGTVIRTPLYPHWQDVRTHVVTECDAVIGLAGSRGTADVLQKAMLARKPVFPIGIFGGAACDEWNKLMREGYCNQSEGDLEFLGNDNQTPEALAESIVRECTKLLGLEGYSKRIFIVHGHDGELKSDLARFLAKLGLEPVILNEQPEKGRTIFQKLNDELADVGYGFVLWTPDDVAASAQAPEQVKRRARQNVVFEHGILVGKLGSKRVCILLKGDVEYPSDLSGVLCKKVYGSGINSIPLEIVEELQEAGYPVDANDLFKKEMSGGPHKVAELTGVR